MFLLKKGLRFLLLHSQRDGTGRVRQRPIHVFSDAASLRRQLRGGGWKVLEEEVRERCPDLQPDWESLRGQAERLVREAGPPPDRAPRIALATQRLAGALERADDPDILRHAYRELRALCSVVQERIESVDPGRSRLDKARKLVDRGRFERAERLLEKIRARAEARLPKRRRRFDLADPSCPREYLETLDLLGQVLARQGRHREAAAVLAERVSRCESADARLALAVALHRSCRWQEAVEQYRRLPASGSERFYNEAALWFQQGSREQAVLPILRALARDGQTARHARMKRAPEDSSDSLVFARQTAPDASLTKGREGLERRPEDGDLRARTSPKDHPDDAGAAALEASRVRTSQKAPARHPNDPRAAAPEDGNRTSPKDHFDDAGAAALEASRVRTSQKAPARHPDAPRAAAPEDGDLLARTSPKDHPDAPRAVPEGGTWRVRASQEAHPDDAGAAALGRVCASQKAPARHPDDPGAAAPPVGTWRARARLPLGHPQAATDGYWERYGDLWSAEAREFLLAVAAEPMVRHRLSSVRDGGKRIIRLIPRRAMRFLLERLARPKRERPPTESRTRLTPSPPPRPPTPRPKTVKMLNVQTGSRERVAYEPEPKRAPRRKHPRANRSGSSRRR